MRIERRHLMIGLGIAISLHAGAAVLAFRSPPRSGAQAPGFGGIEIALGTAGGIEGAQEAAPEPEPQPQAEPEPQPEPEPEPVPEPEPEHEPEPEPVPEPEPEPEPVPVPEVKPRPVPKPVPQPIVTPAPQPVAPRRITQPQPRTTAPPALQGTTGQSGKQAGHQTGQSRDARQGGNPAARQDYFASLLAWLQRHKDYPRAARRQRAEGTAMLYFEMDRSGRVLRYELRRGTGYPILDQEVLAMLERAQPLPRPPAEVTASPLKVLVPVEFYLR